MWIRKQKKQRKCLSSASLFLLLLSLVIQLQPGASWNGKVQKSGQTLFDWQGCDFVWRKHTRAHAKDLTVASVMQVLNVWLCLTFAFPSPSSSSLLLFQCVFLCDFVCACERSMFFYCPENRKRERERERNTFRFLSLFACYSSSTLVSMIPSGIFLDNSSCDTRVSYFWIWRMQQRQNKAMDEDAQVPLA